MFKELDPILHSQVRLAIMSLLMNVKSAEFSFLLENINTTKGNLSFQLTKLKEAEYIEMIRLKTAVLLACSLKSGALMANTDEKTANLLYDFGINLGLAFQLQDDLLDSFGSQETFGKIIGGDIVSNKKTFLLIKALKHAGSESNKKLLDLIKNPVFNREEKVNGVLKIYNELNIKNLTQNKIDEYFNLCSSILDNLEIETKKIECLKNISYKMMNRDS